jgi:hypothetical protein
MLAAEVWHYWIAVPLAVMSVLTVIALAVNYVRKMQAVKYQKTR